MATNNKTKQDRQALAALADKLTANTATLADLAEDLNNAQTACEASAESCQRHANLCQRHATAAAQYAFNLQRYERLISALFVLLVAIAAFFIILIILHK